MQRFGEERIITETIRRLIEDNKTKLLLLYASLPEETGTDDIAEYALQNGIELYYPLVQGTEMEFYHVHKMADLIPGYRGIREPEKLSEKYCNPYGSKDNAEEDERYNSRNNRNSNSGIGITDLIIVPGCAFTKDGLRLGYGGGFYDRYLAKHPELYKVGICFKEQLFETLPVDAHDVRMDLIISP